MITLLSMMKKHWFMNIHALFVMCCLVLAVLAASSRPGRAVTRNSWRGITPLHSSTADVARVLGLDGDPADHDLTRPFKVEGGEVTFSYLSPSLAEMFKAPKSMSGKVFTVYFKPIPSMARQELNLAPEFKRCVEDTEKTFYYFVSDAGVAYRFVRGNDMVDTVIYQPSRAEVRRLAVNTTCVF